MIVECARRFAPELDARFFLSFWETKRFEIFEGARQIVRDAASEMHAASVPTSAETVSTGIDGQDPQLDSTRCDQLLRGTGRVAQEITNISADDVELMRRAYRSLDPDPHVARDRSLRNDCMKANFNSGHRDFDGASRRCDCVLSEMDRLPQDQLDDWFAKARSGAPAQMTVQPWWSDLAPKLQACSALK